MVIVERNVFIMCQEQSQIFIHACHCLWIRQIKLDICQRFDRESIFKNWCGNYNLRLEIKFYTNLNWKSLTVFSTSFKGLSCQNNRLWSNMNLYMKDTFEQKPKKQKGAYIQKRKQTGFQELLQKTLKLWKLEKLSPMLVHQIKLCGRYWMDLLFDCFLQ
jgi:hypothetical protein